MKKLVLTTLITGALAGSVFAQGSVAFTAATSRPIQYTVDGTTKISVPAGTTAQVGTFGTLNVAVYSASVGTLLPTFSATSAGSLSAAWTESTSVLHKTGPSAGAGAANFTLGTGADTSAQIIILGWTGTATTWADALTSATMIGWTGSQLSTGSLSWNNTISVLPNPPAVITTGALGYNGLVLAAVPEPSTFALAGLGIASLLIFRRRNSK